MPLKKRAKRTVPIPALTATPTAAAVATPAASAASKYSTSKRLINHSKVYLKGDALFASPNYFNLRLKKG
jgi:hypothetical protein